MHWATHLCCRTDDLAGRFLQGFIVVFGDDERGHGQITPASFFSLSSNSATVFTLMPAWRLGGSLTLRTFSLGVVSTPKSAGDFSSIGFFLAFMMFGRDA